MARPSKPMDHERRARLFNAAAAEFARGYEAASLNSILTQAGVSKSSFYHFFSDKEELFDILSEAAIADFSNRIELPDPGNLMAEDYWDRIRDVVVKLGEATIEGSSSQWLADLFYVDDAPASGPLATFRNDIRTWISEVTARGREIGTVITDLPLDLQVDLTWAIILVVNNYVTNQDDPAMASQVIWQAVAQFLPENGEFTRLG